MTFCMVIVILFNNICIAKNGYKMLGHSLISSFITYAPYELTRYALSANKFLQLLIR
jgi:hypothetical protein